MSTILLVEDNPHIMKINSEFLNMKGYDILKAESVEECRKRLHWNKVDLVVLDVMLPDGNGLSLCREIKENYGIPILFLSALSESKDIVEGLRAGGDDYLAKPYDLEVLIARIEARLRSKKNEIRFVNFGPLKLDKAWGCGYISNEDMALSPKEFALLLLLVENAEKVVSTSVIINEIWHDNSEDATKSLWTALSRLRKKLKGEKTRIEISAVRGEGYIIEQI